MGGGTHIKPNGEQGICFPFEVVRLCPSPITHKGNQETVQVGGIEPKLLTSDLRRENVVASTNGALGCQRSGQPVPEFSRTLLVHLSERLRQVPMAKAKIPLPLCTTLAGHQ